MISDEKIIEICIVKRERKTGSEICSTFQDQSERTGVLDLHTWNPEGVYAISKSVYAESKHG